MQHHLIRSDDFQVFVHDCLFFSHVCLGWGWPSYGRYCHRQGRVRHPFVSSYNQEIKRYQQILRTTLYNVWGTNIRSCL